jgi:hypothetical protein
MPKLGGKDFQISCPQGRKQKVPWARIKPMIRYPLPFKKEDNTTCNSMAQRHLQAGKEIYKVDPKTQRHISNSREGGKPRPIVSLRRENRDVATPHQAVITTKESSNHEKGANRVMNHRRIMKVLTNHSLVAAAVLLDIFAPDKLHVDTCSLLARCDLHKNIVIGLGHGVPHIRKLGGR